MSGYFITISECVPWEKLSNRWCSKRKDAWGYSVFWLLDQTPWSNMVIMKTFCKHKRHSISMFKCQNSMKAVLCKSTNNCYFRKCFIRHYQSCTSKQSSFLVLLPRSNACQTEFLLVGSHVKGFTALRWYILFYTRHILILTATLKKLDASH